MDTGPILSPTWLCKTLKTPKTLSLPSVQLLLSQLHSVRIAPTTITAWCPTVMFLLSTLIRISQAKEWHIVASTPQHQKVDSRRAGTYWKDNFAWLTRFHRISCNKFRFAPLQPSTRQLTSPTAIGTSTATTKLGASWLLDPETRSSGQKLVLTGTNGSWVLS